MLTISDFFFQDDQEMDAVEVKAALFILDR